jgi:hypothetical protein
MNTPKIIFASLIISAFNSSFSQIYIDNSDPIREKFGARFISLGRDIYGDGGIGGIVKNNKAEVVLVNGTGKIICKYSFPAREISFWGQTKYMDGRMNILTSDVKNNDVWRTIEITEGGICKAIIGNPKSLQPLPEESVKSVDSKVNQLPEPKPRVDPAPYLSQEDRAKLIVNFLNKHFSTTNSFISLGYEYYGVLEPKTDTYIVAIVEAKGDIIKNWRLCKSSIPKLDVSDQNAVSGVSYGHGAELGIILKDSKLPKWFSIDSLRQGGCNTIK